MLFPSRMIAATIYLFRQRPDRRLRSSPSGPILTQSVRADAALMSVPPLSICLPVYNGERYLAVAITSLLRQTFSDFELVISDNASTDGTQAICRDFASRDKRIRYHRTEKNLGAAPNFNRAYTLSRGPLVRWASHDDLWAETAMETCVAAMNADASLVACHGQTVVIDEDGNAIADKGAAAHLYDPPRKLDDPVPSRRLRDLLLHTHWCYEIFGVIRRPALERTGLHGSFYGSDKVLLAELLMQGRIATVNQPLFFRRDHSGNSTSLRTHGDRADWIDTSLAGVLPRRPHVKLLSGYLRAIRRSELSFAEKLSCYRVVASWMLQFGKLKNAIRESDVEDANDGVPTSVGM
jgi:glycosyltransferase involved in cell wall biosynthesis